MKELIKELKKEFKHKILAREYSVIKLDVSTSHGYVSEIELQVGGVLFRYTVSNTFLCDHSDLKLINSRDLKIVNHFLKLHNEKFNSKEIKSQRIEQLKAEIKSLQSKK